jgi:excinuclease ABC subunit B
MFKLKSKFQPTGDQPQAINFLSKTISDKNPHQTLIGVTGSGKTFSVAKIIEQTQLPTLIIAHNKTLAGQLYQEFRDFFPESAVSYFVSYYDYYQPEAYIPQTDTYIEKEADINAEIDRLRLSTTANLLSRPDCIVIASVSCIYNLGSPFEYQKNLIELVVGQLLEPSTLTTRLIDLQYSRTRGELIRGTFRMVGSTIQLYPAYEEIVISLEFEGNTIKNINYLDPINFSPTKPKSFERSPDSPYLTIYPAKHFIADPVSKMAAFKNIRNDLEKQIKALKEAGRMLEAQRLEQKVNYDLQMLEELGFVSGIENYSRYFDGRTAGDPPFTLLDHFHHNVAKFKHDGFLTVIDESHITVPQVRGMFAGDRSRKQTLIDYGFRLPSALDNRPLTYPEFSEKTPITLYTSATPADLELSLSKTGKIKNAVAHQYIRPTGLLDPTTEVRPTKGQAQDIINELTKVKKDNQRALVLTLTKKMAEDLTEYIKNDKQSDIKVAYLHSDIKTLDRQDVLDDLRAGKTDVIVGINLLREGLDLPEVALICILDADKEGFLRTPTSLIQIMGRAARHVDGKVILYADRVSNSMKIALDETKKRREYQMAHNKKHGITPISINKSIREKLMKREDKSRSRLKIAELADFGWKKVDEIDPEALTPADKTKLKAKLTRLMNQASKNWEFEQAADYRDLIQRIG